MHRVLQGGQSNGGSPVAPILDNQRKNDTTIIAGITGVHHAFMPSADNEVGPSQRITSMIEPCIILGMGVTVALILAAIYLPMFSMGGSVH